MKQRPHEPVLCGAEILSPNPAKSKTLCTSTIQTTWLKRSLTRDRPSLCPSDSVEKCLDDNFNYAELPPAIANLKCGKPAGPDTIFPKILVNLGSSANKLH